MSISAKKSNGLRSRMELSPELSKGIFSPTNSEKLNYQTWKGYDSVIVGQKY